MKVVVCGAGIAGLALAGRLDTLGAEVTVLERAPAPRPQGYMIDFFGAGYDAAEAMDVLPAIRRLGHHIEEAVYRDEAGRRRSALKFDQFARTVDGRLTSIMRPDLERALREHLSPAVDLRYGARLVGVDDGPDGVRVTLAGGEVLDADLLVGADGIHSTVRGLVFGPERDYLRYLGFHTAAYVFTDPAVHATVAGTFSLTDTVNRQMGFYGLGDDRVAVFAVHRTPDPAVPAGLRDAVRREYATLGWVAPNALAACPPDEDVYYDQVAQIVMPRWHRGRVVLLGDACYAVSLLAGQGASLGITGAYVLAEYLSRAGTLPEALAGYETTMRPVAEEKQEVARSGVRWFVPSSRSQLRVRRVMLGLARLPLIDRYVAGVLVGKSTAVVRELAATGQRPRTLAR